APVPRRSYYPTTRLEVIERLHRQNVGTFESTLLNRDRVAQLKTTRRDRNLTTVAAWTQSRRISTTVSPSVCHHADAITVCRNDTEVAVRELSMRPPTRLPGPRYSWH